MKRPHTVAVGTLRRRIEKWLVDNGMKLGIRIYTPKEWRARGETEGADAKLTLAARSADAPLFRLLNLVQPVTLDGLRKAAALGKILYDAGYWYDQGHVWSWHIYHTDSKHQTHLEKTIQAFMLGTWQKLNPARLVEGRLTMLIRVIPNNDSTECRIGTVKLIRDWARMSLRDAKATMERSLPFDSCTLVTAGESTLDGFVRACYGTATVVIGDFPVPPTPCVGKDEGQPRQTGANEAEILLLEKEVKAMHRKLVRLMNHMGLEEFDE